VLLHLFLLFGGAVLVLMTLRDVFETVVVPGGSRATLHVSRRLIHGLLPIWKRVNKHGLSRNFAPFTLFASFVTWVAFLTIGFGMMATALATSFQPPLKSIWDGIFVALSGMTTLGVNGSFVRGGARWIVTGAGLCGLGVITLAVTYLLEVQTSISERDTGIFKLKTSAGDPPSAIELLERYSALGVAGEIGHILEEGRNWCATVRQSHSAHPTLIYFRTVGTGSGWPASLGALLDLALICQLLIEAPDDHGKAILLRAEGCQMLEELAKVAGLAPAEGHASKEDFGQLRLRLSEAGYPLQKDANMDALVEQRQRHSAWVDALAAHLGLSSAPLVSC
jgi:hypothetical protein